MNLGFILFLFIVAMVCCAVGFKRFVWFLSIGYGYAVAGIAIALLIAGLISGEMGLMLIIGTIVMAAYGIRLGTFLFKRETGNKVYKKILEKKAGGEPPVFVKIVAWPLVAALYVCETAGLHFRFTNGSADDVVLLLGIIIMICGAVIEALADKQKSAQKAVNPDMPAMEGLFRFVRCPNYFGEILFWTGVFVAGLTTYQTIAQWIMALIGYLGIFYVMWDGAKRMEKSHIARYGSKPEYQAYAGKTPILIPFVPLYHIYKGK